MNASTSRASRRLLPLIVTTVVVIALVAVTLWMRHRPSSASDTRDEASAQRNADSQRRDALPPAAPAGAARSARAPMTLQDAEAAAVRDSVQRRAARANSVRKAKDMETKVAAQFAAEKVDPAWAPTKQVDLKKIAELPQITSAVPAPKQMAVDCRSSMCRIEGTFDASGSAQDWTLLYLSSVGDALPSAVVSRVQNPDGTSSVRIYGRAR